jgi:hypothetical protein
MKKAVIEQFLLGFILVFATITFMATVGDEISARNKATNIKEIAYQTANTMVKGFEETNNMCWAKQKAEDILDSTKLGQELIKLKNTGEISFTYDYYDYLPLVNDSGGVGDNHPDTVIVNISNYSHKNFWYKFFDKDSFSIGPINTIQSVTPPFTLTMSYGGGISGNDNMVGTYQLDNNNCVTNTRVLIDAQDNYSVGDELAEDISSPPTYFFIIPNGGNNFPYANKDDIINISPSHCENTTTNTHTVNIGGTTKYSQKIHFQQDELNNGDTFVHVIPKNVVDLYDKYVDPVEGKNSNSTYNGFINNYCKSDEFNDIKKERNNDQDLTNDIIDCKTDPNGQYKYGMEDWDQGDDDYNDVYLDATQVIIPNTDGTDNYDVDLATRRIVFNQNYCINNDPPTLTLTCPNSIMEDTPTSAITWTATDSDGTVESKNVSVTVGTAIINTPDAENGTITYTPEANYYTGLNETVTLTMTIIDNNGSSDTDTCSFTVTEVNDPPTISGTPPETIQAGSTYSFTPTAIDVDNDTLTFTIQNKPSWASFDTTTGTLSGTPSTADIGIYSNIIITVDDGRGGTASLPAFDIEVTISTSSTDINASIFNNESYSYNLPTSATYDIIKNPSNGTLIVDAATGLLTYTPIITFVGTDTFSVKVTTAGAIITYNFTIVVQDPTGGCKTFDFTFNSDSEEWRGGDGYNDFVAKRDNGRLFIPRMEYVYRALDFGSSCANTKIQITFYYETSNPWDWNDRTMLSINNFDKIADLYEAPSGGKEYTYRTTNFITDDDGWVVVFFDNLASRSNETVYIDYIKLERQ